MCAELMPHFAVNIKIKDRSHVAHASHAYRYDSIENMNYEQNARDRWSKLLFFGLSFALPGCIR